MRAVVALALALVAVDSASAAITFTRIADTSDGSISFRNPYSLNDAGEVAYVVNLAGDVAEIRVGAGGASNLVADTRGRFDSFLYPPAINNAGTVAFTASLDAGGDEIWTIGGTSQLIADTTGEFDSLTSGRINSSGVVAYWARLDSGGEAIRKGDGSGSVPIADTAGAFDFFQTGSGINDAGVVSYWAQLDGGGQNVWASDGTPSTLIASADGTASYLSPAAHAVNSLGAVAFIRRIVGGHDELWVGDGNSSTVVAVGSGFASGAPAVNDAGVVAFVGSPSTSTGGGIFTTLDMENPVVFAGMQLDGRTVGRYDFAGALNNANQIAFHVWFEDGSEGVYRADLAAVPEPISLIVWSLLTSVGVGVARRRRRRFVPNA